MIPNSILARKDFSDYEFVAQEVERLLKLEPRELLTYFAEHPEDGLCALPRPGGGDLPFTLEGERRFHQIALRGLHAMGTAAQRHYLPEVVRALKFEFVSRQSRSASITDENAHDLFEASVSGLTAAYTPLVHFIPCCIVVHTQPPRFKIGPVNFVLRDIFFKENNSALLESQGSAGGSQGSYDEVQRFFSRFRWVATVPMGACDPTVSKDGARKFVQLALDVFKLFIGSARAAGVRQGHDHTAPVETANLVSHPERFSFSWGRKMYDAVVVDDWYDIMSKWEAWTLAELAIEEYFQAWGDVAEPYQRFLDALTWHGEAVSDPEPQSRLVKFWIAIERTVSLRSNDDVTLKAALLSSKHGMDFQNQFKKCQRLCGKRSSIIHGSALRESDQFIPDALAVEALSRTVISSYLFLLDNMRRKGEVSVEGLKAEFNQLRTQFGSPR
jgi:hypothetical protein